MPDPDEIFTSFVSDRLATKSRAANERYGAEIPNSPTMKDSSTSTPASNQKKLEISAETSSQDAISPPFDECLPCPLDNAGVRQTLVSDGVEDPLTLEATASWKDGIPVPEASAPGALVSGATDPWDSLWVTLGTGLAGGVLVQQGETLQPDFVGGSGGFAQVFAIDPLDSEAKWIAGIPVPMPTVDGYVLAGVGTDSAAWTDPSTLADFTDLQDQIDDIITSLDDYLPLAGGTMDAAAYINWTGGGSVVAISGDLFLNAAATHAVVSNDPFVAYSGIIDNLGADSISSGNRHLIADDGFTVNVDWHEANLLHVDAFIDCVGIVALNSGLGYSVKGEGAPILADTSFEVDNGGGANAQLDGTALTIHGDQVVTIRQGAVAHANTSHSCASIADVNTALNALGTVINNALGAIETHGLIAP